MGTASTMAAITAALGLMPLAGATAPAVSSARLRLAEETGARAVEVALANLSPQTLLSEESFLNAITVLQAIGGSTNAVVHLLAIANRHPRVQGKITLQTFDDVARKVPLLIDLKPSGNNYMTVFHNAGGIIGLLHTFRPLLHLNAMTISGKTLRQVLDESPFRRFPLTETIIRPLSDPLYPASSLVVLQGNLAPGGAILKASAAKDRRLLQHSGPAVVFWDSTDLALRIDDPELAVTSDSVLVLQGIGPVGNPGMPEAGLIPIPRKLAVSGVKDVLRILDGRMSGTAVGSIILHVAPESALPGSVFGVISDGDIITCDLNQRMLQLQVRPEEIERRIVERDRDSKTKLVAERGYRALYRERVTQADQGVDFDFLASIPDAQEGP
jgi:dihydroxy-acid dehydratase